MNLEAAEELLDPDVETVTPRGTLRGIGSLGFGEVLAALRADLEQLTRFDVTEDMQPRQIAWERVQRAFQARPVSGSAAGAGKSSRARSKLAPTVESK